MSTHRSAAARRDPLGQARLERDAAVVRGRSITKGVAAASVAGVAAVGIYLSQALPGHTASSGTASSGGSAAAPAGSGAAPSAGAAAPAPSGSGAGFSAPSYTPAPSQYQAPVSSGAS